MTATTRPLPPYLLCVDFGSTFTKAVLVDTVRAVVAATAQHRTTIPDAFEVGDVLDGYDACRADLLARVPAAAAAPAVACSSAGGGLRIGVVGNEELVTAEAGRRVALSSGGKVVTVLAGGLDDERLAALRVAEPDVVLLVGGTDGGNAEPLLADAAVLAGAAWSGPVVVAGDVEARDAVTALLVAAGTPHVLADNVVPRIGELAPDSARTAIRAVFLEHVIGGKHLSARPDFAAMVLGPTPDLVLLGVELLAGAHGSDTPGSGVVVVDVGGATTDVYSVVVPDPEEGTLSREVVATSPVGRTVEGDLGMRWSAVTTVAAATAAGFDFGFDLALTPEELAAGAVRRTEDPGLLAGTPEGTALDRALASAAVAVAVRRHAGRSRVVLAADGRVVERSGKNLRAVDLLVGSGGVLRSSDPGGARAVLAAATGHDAEGWQVPEAPVVVVDEHSVLAAAGLVALSGGDEAAASVARDLICNSVSGMAHGRSTS
ncbi:glutamate mutase L [Marmoricola sp. RAF53]|uniref:glutamate mutase L n=1 Tax=Marmoricola sp. RAF53 TaxID=3233059 RepID=UPI003F964F22